MITTFDIAEVLGDTEFVDGRRIKIDILRIRENMLEAESDYIPQEQAYIPSKAMSTFRLDWEERGGTNKNRKRVICTKYMKP